MGTQSNPTAGGVYAHRESGVTYPNAVALKYVMDPYDFTTLCDAIDDNMDKMYYPCVDADGDQEIDDIDNAYTCVNFALDVWQAIGGTTLSVTGTPKTTSALWNAIRAKAYTTPTVLARKTPVLI